MWWLMAVTVTIGLDKYSKIWRYRELCKITVHWLIFSDISMTVESWLVRIRSIGAQLGQAWGEPRLVVISSPKSIPPLPCSDSHLRRKILTLSEVRGQRHDSTCLEKYSTYVTQFTSYLRQRIWKCNHQDQTRFNIAVISLDPQTIKLTLSNTDFQKDSFPCRQRSHWRPQSWSRWL